MKRRKHPLVVVLGTLLLAVGLKIADDSTHEQWRQEIAEHDLMVFDLKTSDEDVRV